jgi:methylmalonyl-CoA/ethylmalonyl-CoA epimerase
MVAWEAIMKIKRIEHVAVAVKKLEPTMALLEDLFGFKLEYKEDRETARLAMYPFGETYVELVEGKSGMPAQWFAENGEGLFHLCFEVDDIDAALEELRGKGVKLLTEVPKIGHGGCRIAFIDPASTGNIFIELAEMPKGHGSDASSH